MHPLISRYTVQMKSLLLISGSASENSSNVRLLRAIAEAFADSYRMEVLDGLCELPLYTPEREEAGIPEAVKRLREKVARADAVVISTPEYLHNMPAVLKNALEWMTTSGEMADKPVLAITFTPRAPRGEHSMKSLIQSLRASKARVVAELPLYRDQMTQESKEINLDEACLPLITEGLNLL